MDHTQLYKAFEYFTICWIPPRGMTPTDKLRLEQEYVEYLAEQMNIGDQ